MIDSISFIISLFLVKGIIIVLLGSMDKFFLSHNCWTMHGAVCKTSGTVRGNFPLIRIALFFCICYCVISIVIKLQKIFIHNQAYSRGESTPPCGHPLAQQCSYYVSAFQHRADPLANCGLSAMPFISLCYYIKWGSNKSFLYVKICS
jgi:hypothetical protein